MTYLQRFSVTTTHGAKMKFFPKTSSNYVADETALNNLFQILLVAIMSNHITQLEALE